MWPNMKKREVHLTKKTERTSIVSSKIFTSLNGRNENRKVQLTKKECNVKDRKWSLFSSKVKDNHIE